MKEITVLEIIFVVFLLVTPIVAAYLGLRVLKLMKRIKLMRADRNRSLEVYTESREENAKLSNKLREKGIEIDELRKKKPMLSNMDKKIILIAMNMPGCKDEIKAPHTTAAVRKTYQNLKEKIKESFDD